MLSRRAKALSLSLRPSAKFFYPPCTDKPVHNHCLTHATITLRSMKTLKPHYQKVICDNETPISLYHKMAQKYPYAFLLESAEQNKRNGRYSFIGFDPLELHIFPAGSAVNPLELLAKAYQELNYEPDPQLPPLQAGFIGYFSYEIVRHFEKLNIPLENAQIPEGIFFLPKKLLIFDHFEKTLTFIAYDQATLTQVLEEYQNSSLPSTTALAFEAVNTPPAPATSKSSHFENMVKKAKEKILAGEIFQVVLSQKFVQTTKHKPFDLYRKLRLQNPSPYMFYLQYPDFSIIGSSPETLVKVKDNEVFICPIAGTRPRGSTEQEDQKLAEELQADSKECAEHMMLVDLGRNDLGHIAKPGTIEVTKLMQIQKYSHVMHMVSEIKATPAPEKNLFEIFKTAFPAGTLSGAPKIRAMQIIAELEQEPRGIYGGAVGYFDLSGQMDFAIAIRTMLYKDGQITLRAGAGIVYDSIPENENQECHNKARAPLTVL